MSYYIILRGSAGVGKTTIAKKLADKLSGVYFSIDEILQELGLDDSTKYCVPESQLLKAQDKIIPQAKNYLDNDRVVIFDAAYYFQSQIDNLEKRLPSKKFIFTLDAGLGECIKRDKQRTKPIGEESVKAVHYLVSKLTVGKTIHTDDKNADQVADEIIQVISSDSNN
ncbi:MAG: AAA family ATPase [bacterium]